MAMLTPLLLVLALSGDVAPSPEAAALRPLYLEMEYDSVLAFHDDPAGLPVDARLLRLRSLARAGRADRALGHAESLLREHPDAPPVFLTASIVRLGMADLEGARAALDRALAAPEVEAEAWLQEALTRLMERDPDGAVASYREALRRDPTLGGTALALAIATDVGRAARDGGVIAEAAARRADALEAQSRDPGPAGRTAAMYRATAGSPLVEVADAPETVEVPIVACYDGSPYWCIELRAGGEVYRALLDTGNTPGLTVHDPALLAALDVVRGRDLAVRTGSEDTLMISHELLAPRLEFDGFALENVPGVSFPKPREPYFDANLNPGFMAGRVVTIDVPGRRVLLRTPERFQRDLAAVDGPIARLPLLHSDYFYVPATAAGAPALALVETGAEDLGVAAGWAERAGVEVMDTTITWRGKPYPLRKATVAVELGGITVGPRRASVGEVRGYPPSGTRWDLMLGPGVFRDLVLSFDPVERTLVVHEPSG